MPTTLTNTAFNLVPNSVLFITQMFATIETYTDFCEYELLRCSGQNASGTAERLSAQIQLFSAAAGLGFQGQPQVYIPAIVVRQKDGWNGHPGGRQRRRRDHRNRLGRLLGDRALMPDWSHVIEVPRPHGFLLWRGKQTAVPAREPLPAGEPCLLVSGGEAFGTVTLGQAASMQVGEFDRIEWADRHRTRPEERKMWWKGARKLVVQDVTKAEWYPESVPVDATRDDDGLIVDVLFKDTAVRRAGPVGGQTPCGGRRGRGGRGRKGQAVTAILQGPA